jgi:LacI family transcriptional regulator
MMQDRFDVVTVDQFHGASLAGRLLREAGVDDVCYIGTGDPRAREYFELDALRLAGFEEGIGFPIAPERRLFADKYDDGAGAETVARYLELEPRPRAVFAVCDDIALGFMLGAKAHGLVAGRDFDLIGFDGQWRGRQLKSGPLSTVAVPADELGRLGAEMLASRLDNPDLPPRKVHLGCTMLRGTTVRTSAEP